MSAYILDTHKNRVPEGVIGELYMSGLGLAQEYANLPEMVAENRWNPLRRGPKCTIVEI